MDPVIRRAPFSDEQYWSCMAETEENQKSRSFHFLLGRFRDTDLERQYRSETHELDLQHVVRALIIVSLVYVSFLPIDLVEQSARSAIVATVASRLGLLVLAGVLVLFLRHFAERVHLELAVFLYIVGFCVVSDVIFLYQDYLEPSTEGYMMAALTYLIATLAAYVLFPMRYSRQILCSACFAIGFAVVHRLVPPQAGFHPSVVANFFVTANVLGLVLSGRIKELRRDQWLAMNEVRHRADDLKHEIEQREVLEDRLREQANTDPLTGIGNRRNFFTLGQEIFDQAQRYKRPLSAVLFDVDHFKHINDTYGHAAGDEVLKTVVGAICGILRKPDVFCRYGGEEFAVLLPESDAVGASRLAERIRSVVEERTIRVNETEEHVTVSVGVAVYTERDKEFGDLITRADDALYSAKRKGRNTVVVSV